MVRSLRNPKKAKRKNKGPRKGEGSSSQVPSQPAKVWQPGVDQLEEGEELQCDPSAYNCLHAFHIGWPCLSFDILHDSLGLVRTDFPQTVYCVAGTQAKEGSSNYIGIFKLSNISGKRRQLVPKKIDADGLDIDDNESDESDSDDTDEEDGSGSGTPVLQLNKVAHEGCINRIRAMMQNPHICASWADTGHVQIWDFSSHLNALAESETGTNLEGPVVNQSPVIKFRHKDEGYALDWSPLVPGRLVSGDCKNNIHLWEPSGASWNVDTTPFVGHKASVEDLQWSPTEPYVFASGSVDGSIAIWDTRMGKSPAASIKAHDADVNVISWNRLASCMLASGSDDGTFSIRDLRLLKEGDSVMAHFTYHKHPITSIEWSPHEASTLAVSSADNQLTIWDFALERDEEEEAEFKAKTQEQVLAPTDLPPQLLFVHQGQKDLKELHWHSQIPGMLISTASDGFNLQKLLCDPTVAKVAGSKDTTTTCQFDRIYQLGLPPNGNPYDGWFALIGLLQPLHFVTNRSLNVQTTIQEDMTLITAWLLSNAEKLGFENKFSACCGSGVSFNFDFVKPCGTPEVTSCPNPDNHISWDGFSMTQQANKFMADYLINSISPQLDCS
ncbi:OLC1v1037696C1 [Oldenlandia corymbosa var. corymbosa]|uniref:OLC1v1037696C1 n=1 Tax=Oldenlandia corymbosa var. corymbosa TaxID=529605 RepID=A0AAV1D0N4_OLDCO|nr:OLC1v1037696C1 [Oldenlandia corymbosa var. corymbosa]